MLRFASQKRNIRVTLRNKRNIRSAENVTLQNGEVIGSYNLLCVARNATSGTGIEGDVRRAQRNGRNWYQREPKLPVIWLVTVFVQRPEVQPEDPLPP
jgi:hypothetical protein